MLSSEPLEAAKKNEHKSHLKLLNKRAGRVPVWELSQTTPGQSQERLDVGHGLQEASLRADHPSKGTLLMRMLS